MNQTLQNLVQLLETEAFESTFISEMNQEMDLPFFSERKEKKFLKKIYKIFLQSLKKVSENIE